MRKSAIFLLCLVLLTSCEDGVQGTRTGQTALDFMARDLSNKTVRLSDFKGKVVLIDFWATWCGPCVMSIPHETELVRKYENQPFVLIGLSQDNQFSDLKRFADRVTMPWVNLYDDDQMIAHDWGVSGIPAFVLIDHKGVIRGRWTGAQALEEIDRRIAELLNEAN